MVEPKQEKTGAPPRGAPSKVTKFVSEHFALVVIGGLALLFTSVARLAPKPPPPQPVQVAGLSSQEHHDLAVVASAASALIATADARPPEPSYREFVGLLALTKAPMLSNFRSYVEVNDAGTRTPNGRRGVLIVDGEIKLAFLLVRVDRPLGTWERVDITFDGKGGHLHAGLPVPLDPKSTTLLYDARTVPHDVFGRAEEPSDWLSLLKPGKRPVVVTFLSSETPGVLEVSLFYECVAPGGCTVKYEPTK